MIEFRVCAGRSIPTTLQELVDPKHSAIIIVDVQNDFCVEGGVYQRYGKHLVKGDNVVKKLRLLIKEADNVGVKIIYLQNTILPDCMSDSAVWLSFRMKMFDLDDPTLIPEVTLEGSWGQQIVGEIRPRDRDLVVKKHRSSGFIGTNLDMLLRINDIRTLLITGVVTEGCVEATARDAQYHDYFAVVLEDCVDSTSKELHDIALKSMARRIEILTSDQVIQAWTH